MDFNFDRIISDEFEWTIVDKAIHDEVVRLIDRITALENKSMKFLMKPPKGPGNGMDAKGETMKTILREMYDYHYGKSLAYENVNPRLKELERKARLVLENGTLLTVVELADALLAQDAGKECKLLCGKNEWGKWEQGFGDHMHKDGCPFAIAYQVLTPETVEEIPEPNSGMDAKTSAIEMAQTLGVDDAVRTVARSGRNHDGGPNWYVDWEDLGISATFGAGTNSATVNVVSKDMKVNQLYHAADFGRHIETFCHGPWVHRLIAHANELRQANEVKRQKAVEEAAQRVLESFREVPF